MDSRGGRRGLWRVGALFGGAVGLFEGLCAIGPAVVWPDRAVLELWSSVALGGAAGGLLFVASARAHGVLTSGGTEPRRSPWAFAGGVLRFADGVAGASLLGFVLWAGVLPFTGVNLRALLATALVAALATLNSPQVAPAASSGRPHQLGVRHRPLVDRPWMGLARIEHASIRGWEGPAVDHPERIASAKFASGRSGHGPCRPAHTL